MTRVSALGVVALSVSLAGAQDPEFAPAPPVTSGTVGLSSVEVFDLDANGQNDLIAATGPNGEILWFESDGNTNPAFSVEHVIDDAIGNALHASAADLDADGDLDVIASVRTGETHVTWYENTGVFPPVFVPRVLGPLSPGDIGMRVNAARAADLDGDTDVDVVVSFYVSPFASQGHVVWFENDGMPDPTFTAHAISAPTGTLENVSDIRIADLDGNAAPDIAGVSETPGSSGGRNRVVWWSSSGGGAPAFQYHSIDTSLIDPVSLDVARLSGNPALDIVVGAAGSNTVVVLNNGGGPTPVFTPIAGVMLNNPRSVNAVDIDSDGDMDIAFSLGTGVQAGVLESNGLTIPSFTTRTLGTTGGFSNDIAAGDLNGDSRPELAVAFPGSGRLDWFEQVTPILNLSSGSLHATFAAAVSNASNGQTIVIEEERLSRDPTIDLVGKSLSLLSDGAFALGQDSSLILAGGSSVVASPGQGVVLLGDVSVPLGAALSIAADTGIDIGTHLDLDAGAQLSVGTDFVVSGERGLNRTVIDADTSLGSFQNLLGGPVDIARIALANTELAIVVSGREAGALSQTVPASLAVYAPDPLSPTGWTGYPVDNGLLSTHGPIAVGDFDGDGLEDIASLRTVSGVPQLRIHLAQDTQTPSYSSSTVSTGITAQHLVAIDLDFDGDTDIVSGQGWFRSSGGALPSFSYVPFPVVSSLRSFGLVVRDFDLDGGRDVAIHCEKRTVGVPGRVGYRLYVMHSDAGAAPSFSPILIQERDIFLSGDCTGAVDCYPRVSIELNGLNTLSSADQNMDSLTDLLLSEDEGITLLLNLGDPIAFSAVNIDQQYAYDEITPADLDGDQDTDLIAASMRGSRVRFIDNTSGTVYEESRSIKPVLRASGGVVLDEDALGVSQLAIIGTGHDRIEIVDRSDLPRLDLSQSTLNAAAGVTIGRGSIRLSGAQVLAGGPIVIGPRGELAGGGVVGSSVFNAGLVRPRGDLGIAGDYAQFAPSEPERPGRLEVNLRSASPLDVDRLIVSGSAAIAGGLTALAGSTFQPTIGNPFAVLIADDLGDQHNMFHVSQMPRLTVFESGEPALGTLYPLYTDFPSASSVRLVPTPAEDPTLGDRGFLAHAKPADAVVRDITGGPGGAPDGYADTAIAYPSLPSSPTLGGVAVFTGQPGLGLEFDFESLALYTGPSSAKPIAIEAGDYDGDGRIEIAVGNSLTTSNQTRVFLLDVDGSQQMPVVDAPVPPLFIRPGAKILDLATVNFLPGSFRAPDIARVGGQVGLVVLSDAEHSGIATAAVYAGPGWDGEDIDVCDDPDSVDPIDVNGAQASYIEGFCATSHEQDKVIVASNPAAAPGMFETKAYSVGDGPTEIRAEDINNDGFPDIVVINENAGTVSVLVNIEELGSPSGRGFAAHIELPLRLNAIDPDPLPSSVALADLDDDGDLDIAVVSTNEGDVRAVRRLTNQFTETGELTFASVVDLDQQPVGVPLLVREADLEGDAGGVMLTDDLVVFVDPTASPRPAKAAGPTGHVAINSQNASVCTADTNGDGILSPADFSAWVAAFNASAPECDQNGDNACTPADFSSWIANYNAGCP